MRTEERCGQGRGRGLGLLRDGVPYFFPSCPTIDFFDVAPIAVVYRPLITSREALTTIGKHRPLLAPRMHTRSAFTSRAGLVLLGRLILKV